MDPMNDDALDRELERALGVEPSPEFVSRVRTRIANEPAPAAAWWPWTLVTASVATAVVIALVVSRGNAPAGPKELARRPMTAAQVSENATSAPSGAAQPATASANPGGTPAAAPGSAARRSTREPVRIEPDILVDARESLALRRLIAGVSDGRIDLSPVLRASTPTAMDLLPIAEIVISPITIERLAPQGAQGERQ